MAGDQPLVAVPLVGIRVARLDHGAGPGEREGVQAGVQGGVAIDLDGPRVDAAERLVDEEVFEVVPLLFRIEARVGGLSLGPS